MGYGEYVAYIKTTKGRAVKIDIDETVVWRTERHDLKDNSKD